MLISPRQLVLIAACLGALAGCDEAQTGAVEISAIGPAPRLVNPNLEAVPPPTALLLQATAQGLVRFDAAGEIEPALAQSWIVSDDGLRYTFRIRRTHWSDGRRVTAQQVVSRLRAAASRASRNPLKPVLGAITDVVAMTDEVLEISLAGPRPNFLQILAQPEMAIILNGRTTGPYQVDRSGEAGTWLVPSEADGEEAEGEGEAGASPDLVLRGEPAAVAVARFAEQETDAVIGGTIGDLPFVRTAEIAAARLQFDPVSGLFGLTFAAAEGPLADPSVREALNMSVDRQAIVSAFAVPGLAPRFSLIPAGTSELAEPAVPAWAASPLPMRRELAASRIAALGLDSPLSLRLAMPDSPGYQLLFAHLRHDWRLIGVDLRRVEPGAPADLRLVDQVAPSLLAAWYLRHFTCDSSAVCDPGADLALQAARLTRVPADRRAQLATANGILTGLTPFIPLTAPVRWSLVSQRLTGFRTNPFGHHPIFELIAERQR